jgi:hypothetical protein
MAHPHESQTEAKSNEQIAPDVYLPAMPSLSAARGRVERFVTNLFRRRGELRKVVRVR